VSSRKRQIPAGGWLMETTEKIVKKQVSCLKAESNLLNMQCLGNASFTRSIMRLGIQQASGRQPHPGPRAPARGPAPIGAACKRVWNMLAYSCPRSLIGGYARRAARCGICAA